MRGHPGENAFEELRRIILSGEREQLRDLRDRLSNKERRSQDIANVLPEAVKLSREGGGELARALQPAVEGLIKESIAKKPDAFVDALHPLIGLMVRRSFAESLRRMMQSLNQALEHTFSWRGLKWRFEALRTGKTFSEVVMLRSLVYRVEQVFLIHRKTGLSLLNVAADPAVAKDSDMVAAMLSAIQDFVRDSFSNGSEAALEKFRVGELQVWIAAGPYAHLAAVIRGDPPRDLRTTLEDTIETIHVLKRLALANFKGDAAPFESVRPELEGCLRCQYHAAKKGGGKNVRAGIALTAVAAFFTAALIVGLRAELRWRKFVRQLNAQPGLAVTAAHKGWVGPSDITGLRDASASDPAEVARRCHIDPARVQFHWKPFFSLDAASVVDRFKKRFNPPSALQVSSKTGVLTLSGSASYEWLERVREQAKFIPGIAGLNDSAVEVTYNPESVLKRFNQKFDPPNSVSASMVENTLVLSGEASQQWLTRVGSDASMVPGIKSVELSKVINLDERTFERSKSIIENAFVYFLTGKDDIATEGFAALSRLPDEIRRCETAAKRLGLTITLEILGYADAVGDEAKNVDLSQRRAHKVADFLSLCGFQSTILKPIGMGEAVKPAAMENATPELAQRRVSFKIVAEPAGAE